MAGSPRVTFGTCIDLHVLRKLPPP